MKVLSFTNRAAQLFRDSSIRKSKICGLTSSINVIEPTEKSTLSIKSVYDARARAAEHSDRASDPVRARAVLAKCSHTSLTKIDRMARSEEKPHSPAKVVNSVYLTRCLRTLRARRALVRAIYSVQSINNCRFTTYRHRFARAARASPVK